jgi:precorrin-6B methylase 1
MSALPPQGRLYGVGLGPGDPDLVTIKSLKAIQAAAPKHLEAVRHCFIDLLTPAQMKALSNIADVVSEHLEIEHSHD